jgi:pimeloyl-ACP methyl ester carboxylesterase
MPEIDLTAGPIAYDDTGGDGPTLVFLHGLAMDGTVWRHVVADMRADHRCVVPTIPLGGHHRPMRPDADLTLHGIARLVAEFLDRLDLHDVVLIQNDWGGAIVVAADRLSDRVGRLVLVAVEAFDNYPPGLPGKAVALASKLPGGINLALQPLRFKPLRRTPTAFGWMSKRPVPDAVMDAWLAPALTQKAIRRDVVKYAGSARKQQMVDATDRLRSFDRPALVVWATEDRIMPPDHGRRLAELLPNATLVEVADSYTLIPEDQPVRLAAALRDFVRGSTGTPPRPTHAHPQPRSASGS